PQSLGTLEQPVGAQDAAEEQATERALEVHVRHTVVVTEEVLRGGLIVTCFALRNHGDEHSTSRQGSARRHGGGGAAAPGSRAQGRRSPAAAFRGARPGVPSRAGSAWV